MGQKASNGLRKSNGLSLEVVVEPVGKSKSTQIAPRYRTMKNDKEVTCGKFWLLIDKEFNRPEVSTHTSLCKSKREDFKPEVKSKEITQVC